MTARSLASPQLCEAPGASLGQGSRCGSCLHGNQLLGASQAGVSYTLWPQYMFLEAFLSLPIFDSYYDPTWCWAWQSPVVKCWDFMRQFSLL